MRVEGTLEDDFTAKASCTRSDVDDMVGCPHDFLIVFHNDDGIANLLQVAQHADEFFGVATMEPYGGFVEDIKRTHKAASQRRGEVDALTFAARKGVRLTIESEIAKSHINKELQAALNFNQ